MKRDPIAEYEKFKRAEILVTGQRLRVALSDGSRAESARRYLADLEEVAMLQRLQWLKAIGVEMGGGDESDEWLFARR